MRKEFRAFNNDSDLAHFKAMSSTVKSMIRKVDSRYSLNVEAALSSGEFKPFWSHIHYFRNPVNPSVLPSILLTPLSIPHENPATYSAFTSPPCLLSRTLCSLLLSRCFESPTIPLLTPSLVELLIGNFDTNVGRGLYGLLNLFFVNCKQYISSLCI